MMGMARRLLTHVLLILVALGVGFALGQRSATSTSTASTEPVPAPADLSGPLQVVDGDTFDVGETRVRLHGVDAPERAQDCLDEAGAPWACGAWATDEVRRLYEGRDASCEVVDTDRYGRSVSRCAVGGEDLGAALVGRGLALAYVAYSEDYLPEQARAEAADLGLWRGTFQAPWDWRREPADLSVTGVETVSAEGGECLIKGNISGSGRIYHLPGSASYDRTQIDESAGERWFCTEAEAEAAGWRAAR
jgi:endonuclease YncB( thermonuclease family)